MDYTLIFFLFLMIHLCYLFSYRVLCAGVYTKNRNFRLYKSSKLGKKAVLELAEDNKFSCRPPKHLSAEEHIFLCSLISNVR